MFMRKSFTALAFCLSCLPATALAGDADETFKWLSETDDILTEGILWNDTFGDGKDRYKTGGLTQSWVFPERAITDQRWLRNHVGALELQGRTFVATPDDTSQVNMGDRPYAQYVGVGAYLRLTGRPGNLTSDLAFLTEDRVGIELGFQGEPLPLFEIQEAVHDMTSMGAMARNATNSLGSEFLANFEARRTWRLHATYGAHDIQFAPYAQVSAGMRENSARLGSDLIVGTSLEARTWNSDLAIGALIPGGSQPRRGWNWIGWVGADIGVVASDIFLDGGFASDGPMVERKPVTARARAGLMLEYENVAISYSLTWLSPEFKTQPEGQVIGAIQLKVRF